jgi:hypothetical protein
MCITLEIESRLTLEAEERARSGLPTSGWPDHHLLLFSPYSKFDVPIGYRFVAVSRRLQPDVLLHCECWLAGATQQWSLPFDEVPCGWKTICLIGFQAEPPQILVDMPVSNYWFEVKAELVLS